MTKWEKLLHSLAAWLLKMAVEPEARVEFLVDVLLYVHACWSATERPHTKQRKPSDKRRR